MSDPVRRAYRAGTWNVKTGRRPERVAREVDRLMRKRKLDVLLLQEVDADAIRALRERFGRQRRVVGFTGKGASAANTCIVVPRDGSVRDRRVHRLETKGWRRAKRNQHKGPHEPCSVVSVELGGARWVAIHLPPRPHTEGYWNSRRVAWATARESVVDLLRPLDRYVAAGDWNKPASSRAVARLIVRRVRGSRRGGGINFVVSRGVGVSNVRKVGFPFGRSDHKPLLFDVAG